MGKAVNGDWRGKAVSEDWRGKEGDEDWRWQRGGPRGGIHARAPNPYLPTTKPFPNSISPPFQGGD